DQDDPFVLLLERCTPGERLVDRDDLDPEHRLRIAGGLLPELWHAGVPTSSPFERLVDVCDEWADLVEERMRVHRPPLDAGVVRRGVALLRELPRTAGTTVVLHGDYNPGNVLTATREPWLVIDPKPMAGDPAYDLCPLLMQVDDPFALREVDGVLRDRTALLAEVSGESVPRILAWCVARHTEWALWSVSRSEPADAEDSVRRAARMLDLLD
ncbi:MAG: phosphotransferase, partial [Williamsia herbipolensis]|nr:phosphotransferase [Williamsia herbipolensis]